MLAVVLLIHHQFSYLTPSCSSPKESLQHTFVCKLQPAVVSSFSHLLAAVLDGEVACCKCRVSTAGSNASFQRSQLLYDKWVLDIPKLLDLAAIYGPDNAALVQQLMQQVQKHLCQLLLHCAPSQHRKEHPHS